MRASEALVLGSTLLKPMPRVYDNGYGFGCALGMMNRAVGGDHFHQEKLGQAFPWLMEARAYHPCGCHMHIVDPLPVSDIVIHLFDHHFELGEWSIARIAEWIESMDPTSEEHPLVAAIEAIEQDMVAYG